MEGHRHADDKTLGRKVMNELKIVFNEALAKYEKGVEKYGAFNPVTDERDFLKETEAEILDGINYLAMFLLKLRATGGRGKAQCCKNQCQSLKCSHGKGGCKTCHQTNGK